MSGIFLSQIVNVTRNSLETLESEYLFNDCDIIFNILLLNPRFNRCVRGVKSVTFLRKGNRVTQFYISRKSELYRSSGYHTCYLIRYSSVRVLFHKPAVLPVRVFPLTLSRKKNSGGILTSNKPKPIANSSFIIVIQHYKHVRLRKRHYTDQRSRKRPLKTKFNIHYIYIYIYSVC